MRISEDTVTTSLLSRREFLLENTPSRLTKEIISQHYKPQQFSYCPNSRIYLFQIGDFSSLERILKDNHIVLQKLPDDMLQFFKRIDQIKCLPAKAIPQIIGPWRLLPHQQAEISFFQKSGGRIIIGDGWAMGKTITAISIIEVYQFHCVLIVCSQILLYNWSQSLSQLFHESEIKILQTSEDFNLTLQNKPYLLISSADVKFISGNSSKLQLLIMDEPYFEWKDYSKIKNAKNIIILSRNGLDKLCELIPLLIQFSNLSEDKCKMRLKQRYQIQENGKPLKHIYELNILSSHFLICHKDEQFKLKYLKPILLHSPSLNATSRFQEIQIFHQRKLKQICSYIGYILTVHQKKVIIIYKSEWLCKCLQKIFQDNTKKQLLSFMNYQKVKFSKLVENSIILFIQTFRLNDIEKDINQSLKYIHKVTHQIQYIKFSEQQEKITNIQFYYPQYINIRDVSQAIQISESIQVIPVPQVDRIKKKSILVYFDFDQPQLQMAVDDYDQSVPEFVQTEEITRQIYKNMFSKGSKQKQNKQQIITISSVSQQIEQISSDCKDHNIHTPLYDNKQQKEKQVQNKQIGNFEIISKRLDAMQQKVQKQNASQQIVQANGCNLKLSSAFTINTKCILSTNQAKAQCNPNVMDKNKKQRKIRKKSKQAKIYLKDS